MNEQQGNRFTAILLQLRRNHAVEAAGEIRGRAVEKNEIRGAGGEVGQVNPRNWIRAQIGRGLNAIILADG